MIQNLISYPNITSPWMSSCGSDYLTWGGWNLQACLGCDWRHWAAGGTSLPPTSVTSKERLAGMPRQPDFPSKLWWHPPHELQCPWTTITVFPTSDRASWAASGHTGHTGPTLCGNVNENTRCKCLKQCRQGGKSPIMSSSFSPPPNTFLTFPPAWNTITRSLLPGKNRPG